MSDCTNCTDNQQLERVITLTEPSVSVCGDGNTNLRLVISYEYDQYDRVILSKTETFYDTDGNVTTAPTDYTLGTCSAPTSASVLTCVDVENCISAKISQGETLTVDAGGNLVSTPTVAATVTDNGNGTATISDGTNTATVLTEVDCTQVQTCLTDVIAGPGEVLTEDAGGNLVSVPQTTAVDNGDNTYTITNSDGSAVTIGPSAATTGCTAFTVIQDLTANTTATITHNLNTPDAGGGRFIATVTILDNTGLQIIAAVNNFTANTVDITVNADTLQALIQVISC